MRWIASRDGIGASGTNRPVEYWEEGELVGLDIDAHRPAPAPAPYAPQSDRGKAIESGTADFIDAGIVGAHRRPGRVINRCFQMPRRNPLFKPVGRQVLLQAQRRQRRRERRRGPGAERRRRAAKAVACPERSMVSIVSITRSRKAATSSGARRSTVSARCRGRLRASSTEKSTGKRLSSGPPAKRIGTANSGPPGARRIRVGDQSAHGASKARVMERAWLGGEVATSTMPDSRGNMCPDCRRHRETRRGENRLPVTRTLRDDSPRLGGGCELQGPAQHVHEQAGQRQVGPARIGCDVKQDDQSLATPVGCDNRGPVLQRGPGAFGQCAGGLGQDLARDARDHRGQGEGRGTGSRARKRVPMPLPRWHLQWRMRPAEAAPALSNAGAPPGTRSSYDSRSVAARQSGSSRPPSSTNSANPCLASRPAARRISARTQHTKTCSASYGLHRLCRTAATLAQIGIGFRARRSM